MKTGLEGIRVVEIGGVAAMPMAGMLLASWGAEVIHVEPPGRGDMLREHLYKWLKGLVEPDPVNYPWEYVSRNKKSIAINLGKPEGIAIVHRLLASADVFANNLRPYELEKFNLTYDVVAKINPKIIYANLTGYGQRGPDRNEGGYDTVAFFARSGVMDLMRQPGDAPSISRPCYGDSLTALSLLSGVLAALLVRERTGVGQEVEVSLFNTALYALGVDISGCLTTGKDALRPHRRQSTNPIRNIYPTKDGRWIMLGMTNAQHLWPKFCASISRPDLENHPKFATYEARADHAEELVDLIEKIFLTKNFAEWVEILKSHSVIWSAVATPLEASKDEQAIANDYYVDWDHPKYGKIRVVNNPIKLSRTPSDLKTGAPELGEHTDALMKEMGYSSEAIADMKKTGLIG